MVCIDEATSVRMYDKVQMHWQTELARLRASLVAAQGDAREVLITRIRLMDTTGMSVVVS
jgi:type I restriction enzyme R subunit